MDYYLVISRIYLLTNYETAFYFTIFLRWDYDIVSTIQDICPEFNETLYLW